MQEKLTVGFFAVRLPLTRLCCQAEAGLPWGQTIPGLGLGLYGCWMVMQADLWFRGSRFLSGRWRKTQV